MSRPLPLSCLTCKRKKIKCDRSRPACGSCVKHGYGPSCSYPSEIASAKKPASTYSSSTGNRDIAPAYGPTNGNHTSSGVLPGPQPQTPNNSSLAPNGSVENASAEKVRQLEQKMVRLENLLKRPRESLGDTETNFADSSFTDQGRASTRDAPPPKRQTNGEAGVKGRLSGKGFKTKYYGASNACSLLAEFPELSQHWKKMDQKFPLLSRLRDPLKAAKSRVSKGLLNGIVDAKTILSHLPDRSVADKLVTCYLEGLATVYHVLHIPSFLKEYDQFWNSPSDGLDIAFAVLLLLVMAAVCSVPELESTSFVGQSSASRNTAVEWIEIGEAWIGNHSQKHISLRYFQARSLVIIAQQMNEYKPKRAWAASGDLLRFAMSAGYHREPTLLKKKTSVFDQEMRRRLWATIVELDLRACLERGMLPSLRVGEWDCSPPLNILDSELDSCQASDQLPACRPANSFTHCSFFRASQESLALRLELLSLINQLSGNMMHSQVIMYDEKLVQTLDELPVWADNDAEVAGELQSPVLAQTLLRTQLLSFRLLLHRQSTLSDTAHSRSHYSRTVCLDCASEILIQYEQLKQDVYFTMLFYTDDVFRAALSICFDLVSAQGRLHFTSASQDGGIFIKQAETSLAMLESKALRLGRGLPPFSIMSIACSLAQSQLPRTSSISPEEEAANRITGLYHKLISLQETPMLSRETTNGDGIAQLLKYSNKLGSNEASDASPAADQGPYDSVVADINSESLDPFGWSLDEFWHF